MKVLLPAVTALLITGTMQVSANTYFEAGIGRATVEENEFDEDDIAFNVNIANYVNDNIGVEIGYFSHGEPTLTESNGSGDSVSLAVESSSIRLGGRFRLPINDNLNIIAQAGMALWDYEISITDSDFPGLSVTADDDGSDIYYGIGIETTMNNGGSAKLLYSDLGIETDDVEFDVKTLSLVLGYKF